MRLPAITRKQQQWEDSRQWSERLYEAFLSDVTIEVPVTRATAVGIQNRISANTRHFWSERGFYIRTRTNAEKTILFVWLQSKGSGAPVVPMDGGVETQGVTRSPSQPARPRDDQPTVLLDQAAAACQVSRRTLYLWMGEGRLPYVMRGASRRVVVADVARLADRSKTEVA